MNLVFATGNPNKVKEVQEILGADWKLKSLKDIGCLEDIPETADTLEGNALLKARYVYEKYNIDCFSEDTGLEIDSLEGAPGVHTARFAGPQKNAEDNMALALSKLEGKNDRAAQFRTVFALILEGKEYLFEGIARGTILKAKKGNQGFGYDPIFQPDGYDVSFAEMDKKTKNTISHRGKAFAKLMAFLKNQQ